MKNRRRCALAIALIVGSWSGASIAKDEPQLTCFADSSVINVGATTTVSAYSILDATGFAWSATDGHLDSTLGREVTWTAPGTGRYNVAVKAAVNSGSDLTCKVEILVSERVLAPSEDTAYLFLEQLAKEASNYAVYSYLLFWDPISDLNREEYMAFMEAFFATIPEVTKVNNSFFPDELNITYVPVLKPARAEPSIEWAIDNYDIGRSRRILSWLGPKYRDGGPYIVSFLGSPASTTLSQEAVAQDFSQTHKHLRLPLIKAYVRQMTQEHDWGETTMQQMMLRLRNTAAHFAEGVVVARDEVTSWIRWIKPAK